jgi:hypothetical protein
VSRVPRQRGLATTRLTVLAEQSFPAGRRKLHAGCAAVSRVPRQRGLAMRSPEMSRRCQDFGSFLCFISQGWGFELQLDCPRPAQFVARPGRANPSPSSVKSDDESLFIGTEQVQVLGRKVEACGVPMPESVRPGEANSNSISRFGASVKISEIS